MVEVRVGSVGRVRVRVEVRVVKNPNNSVLGVAVILVGWEKFIQLKSKNGNEGRKTEAET